jgi:hypothetical protein
VGVYLVRVVAIGRAMSMNKSYYIHHFCPISLYRSAVVRSDCRIAHRIQLCQPPARRRRLELPPGRGRVWMFRGCSRVHHRVVVVVELWRCSREGGPGPGPPPGRGRVAGGADVPGKVVRGRFRSHHRVVVAFPGPGRCSTMSIFGDVPGSMFPGRCSRVDVPGSMFPAVLTCTTGGGPICSGLKQT